MSLPLARSNADRMPPIPNVNTRPPTMAGVDFGPGPCDCAAGLRMYGAGYDARQISLPDATSRARTISSSPWRAITTTRLPDTTGDACPVPTGTSQHFFSASGHCAGSAALTEPSRLGPRHCGQSVLVWAPAAATAVSTAKTTTVGAALNLQSSILNPAQAASA